ncbi:MAG: hypothetical protein ACKO04_10610 [Actinomycetes bacterium]
MRRLLTLCAAAALCVATLATAGCGTMAADNAATVSGAAVTTESVNDLAKDGIFVRAVLGGATQTDESVLDGGVARQALLFQMQRTALLNELDRFGLTISDEDRSAAKDELVRVLSNSNAPGPESLSASTRETLTEFLAAGGALDRRLSKISTSRKDLDLLYRSTPALWERVCISVVQVQPGSEDLAARLAARGVRLEKWESEGDGLTLVASSRRSCLPVGRLPGPLGVALETAKVGTTAGPVVVSDPQATAVYWFRLDRRTTVSRRAATPELRSLAGNLAQQGASTWLGLVLLTDTWVNPQYGSGVEVGSQGRLVVGRPEAPPSEINVPQVMNGAPDGATGGAPPNG